MQVRSNSLKKIKMQFVDTPTVDTTSQDASLHPCSRISHLLSALMVVGALMDKQGLQMN